jgi:two-component system, OmpR family, response regulator CpxR
MPFARMSAYSRPAILLVDDDDQLCALMKDYLDKQGFQVDLAHDGPSGLRSASLRPPSLILLDVMLPGVDGFAVLSEFRRACDTPVVMLTARGEPADRIQGLEAGADDFIRKPFEPAELVARIHAVLRRTTGLTVRDRAPVIEIGGVRLDPGSRTVSSGQVPVDLTGIEYEILEMLMFAAGRAVTRDEICLRLYQREATVFDRAIDVHVGHIRQKLAARGAYVRTIRGSGYLFALDQPGGVRS